MHSLPASGISRRDKYLVMNKMGRAFVFTYYTLSPKVADYIETKEGIKRFLRIGLRPSVKIGSLRE